MKLSARLPGFLYDRFYILLFNSLIFEFKELIPILKLSSFPSIRTSKYIVTIAGNPKLATNCIIHIVSDNSFMCYATTKSNSVVSV